MKHLTYDKLALIGGAFVAIGFLIGKGIIRNLFHFFGAILLTIAYFWMMFFASDDKDNKKQ